MFGKKTLSTKLLLDVERFPCIYTAAGVMEEVGCCDTTASPSVKLAFAKPISTAEILVLAPNDQSQRSGDAAYC